MPTLAVIWGAAGLVLATDAGAVIEALPPVESFPAPGVPAFVRGLMRYRGNIVPLVDASTLLGGRATPDRMTNRVLMVRMETGASACRWDLGLWVERVLDVERVEFGAPGGHPGFAMESARFLGPVAQTRWGFVQLVNPAELFTPEQAGLLSKRIEEAAA